VSASGAWRSSHNISRARMLDLFTRVTTGSGAGACEAALFNGLRVRMVSGPRCWVFCLRGKGGVPRHCMLQNVC
jgi:hypothetical protein